MSERSRDRKAYALAREYLLQLDNRVTEDVLARYLTPPERPGTLAGVYRHLLESAKNRQMVGGVVDKALGNNGTQALSGLLGRFNPRKVVKRYGEDWEALHSDIQKMVRRRGKTLGKSKVIWPLFCRSITSGAAFLSQFASASDFHRWVGSFKSDDRSREALPLLLKWKIDGFGFPLACNFLKEMGYFNFGKPDVHIKDIFMGLNLVESRDDDVIFKAITRIARNQNVTPYNADKLFWLVGSGLFYNHRRLGKNGWIRTDKAKFIRTARRKLRLSSGG